MFAVFGVISAEYVGNGNGNGNSYGVPSGSGPYPPSGWKPSGMQLNNSLIIYKNVN